MLARHNSFESNSDDSLGFQVVSLFSPLMDGAERNQPFSCLSEAVNQGPLDEALLASNRHMEVTLLTFATFAILQFTHYH